MERPSGEHPQPVRRAHIHWQLVHLLVGYRSTNPSPPPLSTSTLRQRPSEKD